MITIYQKSNDVLATVDKITPGSWIQIDQATREELKEIHEQTKIEFKILEKLLDKHEISRVEQWEQATLIVLKMPLMTDHGYRTSPLGIIIEKDYIITICNDSKSLFGTGIETHSYHPLEKTNFIIQVFYQVATLYLNYLEHLQQDLNNREKSLYHATNNDALKGLMQIEKSLVYFMQALSSNELVLERIASGNVIPLYKSDHLLLESAIIENKQAIQMASLYQALLSSLVESYGTIISNNLNQLMKFLAGITIVISIPTMVSSFIGMNVPLGTLATEPYAFPILCVISLIISLLVAAYLKRRNML